MNLAEIQTALESEYDFDYVEYEDTNRVRFDHHGDNSFWLNSDGSVEGNVPKLLKPILLGYGFKF